MSRYSISATSAGSAQALGDLIGLVSFDFRLTTHCLSYGDDRQVGLWLPIQREIDIARKDLPSRAVIKLDDVALRVGPDLHRRVQREAAW
jgi:hypothetical protein